MKPQNTTNDDARGFDFLRDWPLSRVEALYRTAKTTGFFNDPRNMIALREILFRRMRSERIPAMQPWAARSKPVQKTLPL